MSARTDFSLWSLVWRSFVTRVLLAAACGLAVSMVPMALRWPMRILGAGFMVLALMRLGPELDRLIALGRTLLFPLWRKAGRWVAEHGRWLRRVEVFAALVAVVFACIPLSRMGMAMATSSLRTDEIGSVDAYTRRGPFIAATTYNAAKNHILYSVLNSVLPGAASHHPFRARMLSFVALTALLGGLLFWFGKRRWYAEGALAFSLVALTPEFLEVSLESRGYGFLALAAAGSLMAWHSAVGRRSATGLRALGVWAVFGIYTLPYFVVWAGPLLALAWVVTRREEAFRVGIWSAAVAAALYMPVIGGVADVTGSYAQDYGVKFTGIGDVKQALEHCVPPVFGEPGILAILAVGAMALLLPTALHRERTATARSLQIGTALVGGFLVFCLVLATPPTRTTAFLGGATAWLIPVAVGMILRHPLALPVRPAGALVLCGVVAVAAWQSAVTFRFVPKEKWQEAARAMGMLFDDRTTVWMQEERHKQLQAYLPHPGRVVWNRPLDERAFRAGTEIVFDANRDQDMPRVDPAALPQPVVVLPLPVRKGVHQIVFRDPPTSGVGTISCAGNVFDGGAGGGIAVALEDGQPARFEVATGQVPRVFVAVFEEPLSAGRLRIVTMTGAMRRTPPKDALMQESQFVTVNLLEPTEAVEMTWESAGAGKHRQGALPVVKTARFLE